MQRPFPAYKGTEPYLFVSYAHADAAQIYPLLEHLRAQGVNLWYDEGIEPGSRWRDDLANAISNCSGLLYFVTPASVASINCQKEVGFALDNNKSVAVTYLQAAQLPSGLAFSLNDQQAIYAEHHTAPVYRDKLVALAQSALTPLTPAAELRSRGSSDNRADLRLTPTWRRATWVTVVIVLALGAMLTTVWQNRREVTDTGPPVVAVAGFRNVSGDVENDWLSEGLAYLVRDKLSMSRHLVVVSDVRWRALEESANSDDLSAALQEAGVDYLLSGEIVGAPGGLVLTSRVSQLASGIDLTSRSVRELTAQTLVAQADQLALLIKQSLKIPSEEQVDSLAADFAVENLAAYETYIAGLQHFNAFAYDEAERSMRTALELAPNYVMAAYRLANIQASAGHLTEARATLAALPKDGPRTERETQYLAGYTALIGEDRQGAIDIYKGLLQLYPYEIEAQQYLAEAYYRNFQDAEAIQMIRKLTRQEPENLHGWASLGFMLLSVDDTDAARVALTKYQELAPQLPNPWDLLGSLELKEGNVEQAQANYTKALELDPDFSRAQQGLARTNILLGRFAQASAVLSALATDTGKTPRDRVEAALDLVAVLQATGAYTRVTPTVQLVEPLLEDWITLARSEEGLAALRRGAIDEAESLFREALSYEFPGTISPTRFLFCLGLAHIANDDGESLRVVIQRLANLPSSEAGGKLVEKAVAYLQGLDALRRRDAAEAISNFRIAVEEQGYEYRVYRVGLAAALLLNGDLDAALHEAELATQQQTASMAGEIRVDLEVDRRDAQALLIAIRQAQGAALPVQELTAAFKNRWGMNPLVPAIFGLSNTNQFPRVPEPQASYMQPSGSVLLP